LDIISFPTNLAGTYLLQNSRDTTQSYSIDTMTSTTEMITLEGHRLVRFLFFFFFENLILNS